MSKIASDIGENYEYIRTIVSNTIEIKKIETFEGASYTAGAFLTLVFVGIVGFLSAICFVASLVVLLGLYLKSFLYALLIVGTVLLFISIIVFLNRKRWIIDPVSKMMYHKIFEES